MIYKQTLPLALSTECSHILSERCWCKPEIDGEYLHHFETAKRFNSRQIGLIYDIAPWRLRSYDDPKELASDKLWWRLAWPRRMYRKLKGVVRHAS